MLDTEERVTTRPATTFRSVEDYFSTLDFFTQSPVRTELRLHQNFLDKHRACEKPGAYKHECEVEFLFRQKRCTYKFKIVHIGSILRFGAIALETPIKLCENRLAH
jgi:hypothetical protein